MRRSGYDGMYLVRGPPTAVCCENTAFDPTLDQSITSLSSQAVHAISLAGLGVDVEDWSTRWRA